MVQQSVLWKVQLFKLNYDEREYGAVMDTLKIGVDHDGAEDFGF